MNPRLEAMPAGTHVPRRPSTERNRALDDQRNEEMTRLLREAAEIREGRERARSIEDSLLARREATAFLDVIRDHGRPKAQHDASRPRSGDSPRSAEARR
jgi:hypothetical protein